MKEINVTDVTDLKINYKSYKKVVKLRRFFTNSVFASTTHFS